VIDTGKARRRYRARLMQAGLPACAGVTDDYNFRHATAPWRGGYASGAQGACQVHAYLRDRDGPNEV